MTDRTVARRWASVIATAEPAFGHRRASVWPLSFVYGGKVRIPSPTVAVIDLASTLIRPTTTHLLFINYNSRILTLLFIATLPQSDTMPIKSLSFHRLSFEAYCPVNAKISVTFRQCWTNVLGSIASSYSSCYKWSGDMAQISSVIFILLDHFGII